MNKKLSPKKAVRRMAQQRYNAKDAKALISELNTSSDRPFAIIQSALVEDSLRAAITSRFQSLSQGDDALIFEDYGPLATFAGKILVGYAMGVITETQRFDLSLIKHIRNAFAHAVIGISFNDQQVHDVCMMLRLPDTSKLPEVQQTARWRFSLSCQILHFQLSKQYKNMYLGSIPISDLIADRSTQTQV